MPHSLETQPQTMAREALVSPLAGKPAPREMLIDVAHMEKEYFEHKPDVGDPNGFSLPPQLLADGGCERG